MTGEKMSQMTVESIINTYMHFLNEKKVLIHSAAFRKKLYIINVWTTYLDYYRKYY